MILVPLIDSRSTSHVISHSLPFGPEKIRKIFFSFKAGRVFDLLTRPESRAEKEAKHLMDNKSLSWRQAKFTHQSKSSIIVTLGRAR